MQIMRFVPSDFFYSSSYFYLGEFKRRSNYIHLVSVLVWLYFLQTDPQSLRLPADPSNDRRGIVANGNLRCIKEVDPCCLNNQQTGSFSSTEDHDLTSQRLRAFYLHHFHSTYSGNWNAVGDILVVNR